MNTEIYLCHRDHDIKKQKNLDLFYLWNERHGIPICNAQLKVMWKRVLHIYPAVRWLAAANALLPGSRAHEIGDDELTDIDRFGLLEKTAPHLFFTIEEKAQGEEKFYKMGIPPDQLFICFNARSSQYLRKHTDTRDWHYHDYRDSDINHYLPAVEELTKRGFWALRMGAVETTPFSAENPRIIDYSLKHRTEFMDVFLGSRCSFFLCDTGGINAVPAVFRKPIAWVNFIPLAYLPSWNSKDLFIPKKLWFKNEKRFLTFQEIKDWGVSGYLRREQYEQRGIEPIENSAEEITALAIEMDERLKGSWRGAEEDEVLQKQFFSIFLPSENIGKVVSRIGAEFLRQNKQLLAPR